MIMIKESIARLITNVINPFMVSSIIIVLLSFEDAADISVAIKWATISLTFSVLPLLMLVIYRVRRKKLDNLFASPRRQRTMIYLIASVLGVSVYGMLSYMGAPERLVATFAAGMVAIVTFMVINFFWKISLHTAFVSGAVTVLIIIYGALAIWTVLLMPIVAWSRVEMKQHSAVQVMAGTLLAAGTVTSVFWGYGIIG